MVIALVLFALFIPLEIEFYFFVEETKEPIDGDVYLGDKYLGMTKNGRISIDQDILYPGELSIRGTYQNSSFNFIFNLNEDDLELENIEFLITSEDIEDLTLKSINLNTEKIEDEIFILINSEREKQGITKLKRSMTLDKVAKDYSDDMAINDFYAHTNPEKQNLHDRLVQRNIFFFAASENLNYIPVFHDTNVSEETVSGWIESPGHRIPILDTNDPIIWDSIGIGVSCVDREDITYETTYPVCYVTAEFVAFERHLEDILPKTMVQFIYLYDPDLGLESDTLISIDFSSDEKIDFYIVPDKEQYDRLLYRKSFERIIEKKRIDSYQADLKINPGYGVILDASRSNKKVSYTLSFVYD